MIEPTQICLTAGANNAFYSALNTLTQAGDEIILLTPYYFNHAMAAQIQGLYVKEVFLNENLSFEISLEHIQKQITPKTRALVLVNPSNPTGRSYSQNEITGLYKLCQSNNIILMADEVYNYFHDDFPNPPSIIKIPHWESHAIVIHSYSKTLSLTGYRIGFVLGSQEFIHHFLKIQDTNIICAPHMAQLAVSAGLQNCVSWIEKQSQQIKTKNQQFTDLFKNHIRGFQILSSGGFFAYINYLHAPSVDSLCQRALREENLVMLPGHFFGSRQEKNIRLSLGNLSTDEIPLVINAFERLSHL